MFKTLLSLLFLTLSFVYAKPSVVVSILPQQTFVQKIAQDKVTIHLMVTPGSSPHSYEPKPSQMVAISQADLYFSTGVEFEKVWIERFRSQNEALPFIDISAGIQRIAMQNRHTHEEETHEHHADAHHHDHHDHAGLDPHTWTSPANVKIMAHNIYESLVDLDAKNEAFYKKNLETFLAEIENTDQQIRDLLKPLSKEQRLFLVFHPSWGYFAKEYDLTQVAVEVDGKAPKPKDIMHVVHVAKEKNVQVILAQPEFSDKSAKIIAKESNIKVEKISPLHPEWSTNLIKMAKAIARQ